MKATSFLATTSVVFFVGAFAPPSFAECVSPMGCDYTLNCQIENLTEPLAEVFAPGDNVRISVDIDVPNSVAELECQMSAFVEAKILNYDFLGEIKKSTFIVDDCAARREQPFVDRFEGKECQGKTEIYHQEFTLPDDVPNSTGSLLVQIQCGKAGMAGKTECRQAINIETFD